MKIIEITLPSSDKVLFEQLNTVNDTGFLTEDLVKIARENQSGTWTEPVSADEFLAEMDSWENE
jgi:hypothetical protein